MELKAALTKLKSAKNKPMFFFFCEAGEDGKPVLVVDNKKIPPKEQQEILGKAKKKVKCSGTMTINDGNELNVKPKGSVPSNLAKGIQMAARNESAMVFSGITIGEPEAEETENESEQSPTGTVPPPPPPPGAPPTEALTFKNRLQQLSPIYIKAIQGKPAVREALEQLSKKATEAAKAGNYTEALKALDKWEEGIKSTLKSMVPPPPPPPPPPSPQGADKDAVLRRLNGMKAAILTAAKGPDAARVQTLVQSVNGLLKNSDAAQAGKVLDELEPLLAKAGSVPPPPPPPSPTASQGADEEEVEEGAVDVDQTKFRAGWAQAKSAWQEASDEVDGQINKLTSKLRASDDNELKQIAEYGLNAVTGDHKVPLMAAIRELDGADGNKLKSLVAKAGAIANSFKSHIDSDERVKECDANPFGVPVTIKKSIGGALDKLNAFFATVKKG
jgi:hypothetical protein